MLPNLSVVWVIAIVLLAVAVCNRLIFKPLLNAMRQREQAIASARALADKAAAEAAAATAEFEARTTAARAEIYREMDQARRSALGMREELLAATREEISATTDEATTRLRAEADEARRQLRAEAEALGGAIAERVLDRKVS